MSDWYAADYDDSSWKTGVGGFGTKGTPGSTIGTEWRSEDIWLRREFDLPNGDHSKLQLYIYYDDDAEVFVNRVPVASFVGFSANYLTQAIPEKALATMKEGKNVIAIHCHQGSGGQFVDAGFVTVEDAD